jgi:DNA polymerase IV
MNKLGIKTGRDLRLLSQDELTEKFGKSGQYYYNISRGIDHRPVRSQRIRKSLGKETTFAEDVLSVDLLLEKCHALAEHVLASLTTQKLEAYTLTLKVKYANFQQVTRAYTADEVLDFDSIKSLLPVLMAKTEAGKSPVRLVGLSLSGFDRSKVEKKQSQLDLELGGEF